MGRAPSRPAERFAAAVSSEIRAEMGRQNISKTKLEAAIPRGFTYITDRLEDRLPFDLNDLDDIARALGVKPETLIQRAERAMKDELAVKRAAKQAHERRLGVPMKRSARKPPKPRADG